MNWSSIKKLFYKKIVFYFWKGCILVIKVQAGTQEGPASTMLGTSLPWTTLTTGCCCYQLRERWYRSGIQPPLLPSHGPSSVDRPDSCSSPGVTIMYMCTNTCMMNSRANYEVCNITGSPYQKIWYSCILGMIETTSHTPILFLICDCKFRVTAHGINIIIIIHLTTSESVS